MNNSNLNQFDQILKPGYGLSGSLEVPGDKSISHRALLFGSIADGITSIKGILPAEDPRSTANCLRAMGVKISTLENNSEILVEGVGLNGFKEPSEILDCGNSGTTMRLMMGILAGQEGKNFVLSGDKSLSKRPMNRVGHPLKIMGANIFGRANGNYAPISINGRKLHGAVIGTPVASAQIKSAILLAGLYANGATSVIEPANSRDHTERMLRGFGANIEVKGDMGRHIHLCPGSKLIGQKISVPGDISSASFWLVGGSIIPGSNILIKNIGLNPTRTGILEILESMEANIEIVNEYIVAGEPAGDIRVKYKENLKAFSITEEIIPRLIDEIPILAVAACCCEGDSVISGAKELRVKETDRLAVMNRQLNKMGARITEKEDGLIIKGKTQLKGASLNSETDHRVAMSLAIASLIAKGESKISGANDASVSYPNFWDQLREVNK